MLSKYLSKYPKKAIKKHCGAILFMQKIRLVIYNFIRYTIVNLYKIAMIRESK